MFNGLQEEFLDEMLKKYKGLPTVGSATGFVSAVLCGGVQDLPKEYYGHIIGKTLEGEELDEFVTLIIELHNEIKEQLEKDSYDVPLDFREDGSIALEGWVLGFNVGMALAPEYWKEKMEKEIDEEDEEDNVTADLLAISLYASLIGEEHNEEEKVLFNTCYEHISDDMGEIVLDFYEIAP